MASWSQREVIPTMPFEFTDTQELELPPLLALDLTRPPSSTVQVDIAGLSHPGNVRPNNEDHFLVVRFGRFLESLETNLPADQVPARFEEYGYGLAIADGMGGHAAGEEASRLAITTLLNLVLSAPDWILRADDPTRAEEIMRRAAERFEHIDRTLADQADKDPQLRGFGTTMTFAASVGRNLFIAHTGDTRAYLYRRGKLHQLTRDHTLAGELYEAGEITRDQAARHHLRHVLTRNLGADRGAKPDLQKITLDDGDSLLFCSDGLSDMVSSDQIADVLALDASAKSASARLIDLALAAGGKDNVTVVVARYLVRCPGDADG
jgi:serine/threonine protein phosphatase PrpC